MNASPKVALLLLAAGEASRMGEPKQLLDIQGESLIRRMLQICLSTPFRPFITVLGAYAEQIHSEIGNLPTTVIINENWAAGIGSSIAAGMSTIEKVATDADAVLIVLCDQPLVDAEILKQLVEKCIESRKNIVASVYANTMGVPAIFEKKLFPDLKALKNNQGAKKIITQHWAELAVIPFPEGALDLDTPEDYENFIRTISR